MSSLGLLPGHGARQGRWDPGARSPADWVEADFVRAVAMSALGSATSNGVKAAIASEGEYTERGRVLARLVPGAPVVQIHADAVDEETGPDRTTVFYWPTNAAGKALAEGIAAQVRLVVPWLVAVTAAKEEVSWHAGARSCLRQIPQTSVLIECGFTDGAQGRTLLPALAANIGKAIVRAVGGDHG